MVCIMVSQTVISIELLVCQPLFTGYATLMKKLNIKIDKILKN